MLWLVLGVTLGAILREIKKNKLYYWFNNVSFTKKLIASNPRKEVKLTFKLNCF